MIPEETVTSYDDCIDSVDNLRIIHNVINNKILLTIWLTILIESMGWW